MAGDFNRLRYTPLCSYPLKQTVKTATRGAVVLDKIYTNIADWYSQPVVIPKIATADHLSVLMWPCNDGDHRRSVYRKSMETRSHDHNGKVLLAHTLNSYNWDHLYKMSTCDEMTSCFYNSVTQMLDKFLPVQQTVVNKNDKPWVTQAFRRTIRRRQYAWTNRHMNDYRRYRNLATRQAKALRRRFYEKKVRDLRICDSRNWWRYTKRFLGHKKQSELSSLANAVTDGDMQALAEAINA